MRAALVLGGGACLWDDVEAAVALGEFAGVVACNDAAAVWPGKLDAAVSLHCRLWPKWLDQRAAQGLPAPARVLGHDDNHMMGRLPRGVTGLVDYRFPGQVRSGSSGLFALKVALIDLGFDKAVLCGVPMSPAERHFFDPRQWGAAHVHRKGWEEAFPAIGDRARSMSGWTAQKLGRPDAAWLAA